MNENWIAETLALIDDYRSRREKIQTKVDELLNELRGLDSRIDAAKTLIQDYREKHGISSLPLEEVKPGFFGNKSYPEMLREIASKTEGTLRTAEAVEAIFKAGAHKKRRGVQANVFSTLKRLKKEWIKVGPGEYKHADASAWTLEPDSDQTPFFPPSK